MFGKGKKGILRGISIIAIIGILSVLIAGGKYVPQRENATIISSQNQFQHYYFNATSINVELKQQGFIGNLYSLHYVPVGNSLLPSSLFMEASSAGSNAMTIECFNNSSMNHPTNQFQASNMVLDMFSKNFSEPLTSFAANYTGGNLSSSVVLGEAVSGSLNPPENTSFGFSPDSFYSKFTDYVSLQNGNVSNGEFTLNLQGGYSGYQFEVGINLSVNTPLLTLNNGKIIFVNSSFLKISGYQSLYFTSDEPGYFPLYQYAISEISLNSDYPPYAEVTLSSNQTQIYDGNGGLKVVKGTTTVSGIGDISLKMYQNVDVYSITISSQNALIFNGGKYLYTNYQYWFGYSFRVILGLVLGMMLSVFCADPLKRLIDR